MNVKTNILSACVSLTLCSSCHKEKVPGLTDNTTVTANVNLIAGSSTEAGNADNENPLQARFQRLGKITWDNRNNTLYILDAASTSHLRKIDQQGVSTVANAAFGLFNEGYDISLAPGAGGNLYVTTSVGQLLKVNTTGAFNSSNPNAIIDWRKADGSAKVDGNKIGSLDEAAISGPLGLAMVPGGKVYFANSHYLTVHQVNFNNTGNEVTEFAGKPTAGVSAPAFDFANGQGSAATFGAINDMDADGNGNIYVADGGYCTVRKITSSGLVSSFTIPTPNTWTYYVDKDGDFTNARSGTVKHVAANQNGNIIYFTTPGTLRAIIPSQNKVVTIAKIAGGINGISTTPDGSVVYVAGNHGIYKVTDIKF